MTDRDELVSILGVALIILVGGECTSFDHRVFQSSS